jgi:hypothetical protein
MNNMIHHEATLQRFKEITAALADCYVTAGWHDTYNPALAEPSLKYLESRAAGGPEDPEAEKELTSFIQAHGQSLDYLYGGEIRCMIAHLAASSPVAQAIPAERRDDGMADRIEPGAAGLSYDLAKRLADA